MDGHLTYRPLWQRDRSVIEDEPHLQPAPPCAIASARRGRLRYVAIWICPTRSRPTSRFRERIDAITHLYHLAASLRS